MSHFIGLVVLTPEYAKTHDLDASLAKYNEQMEVPEYSLGEISDFQKIQFIEFYSQEKIQKNLPEILYENLVQSGIVEPCSQFADEYHKKRYLYLTMVDHKEEYVDLFKTNYPELFDGFSDLYLAKGEDWNCMMWRINPETKKWEEFSTRNPDSKWDWYVIGGRWHGALNTKSKTFTNECELGEIDWEKKSVEDDVALRITKQTPPFCLVVDGEWHEEGKMLWWGMTANEKDDWNTLFLKALEGLPSQSRCYVVDFHI